MVNPVSDDGYGQDISLNGNGNKLVITNPNAFSSQIGDYAGFAEVYEYINGNWNTLGNRIWGESAWDNFGISASLDYSGNNLCVGAWQNDGQINSANDNRGSTTIYNYNGSSWEKVAQELDGENSGDKYGSSSEISGNGNSFITGPSNTLSGAKAKIYSLESFACPQPLDITIYAAPTIDLGADNTLICAGTTETLDVGTGFASYLWNDGSTAQTLSATTAGTYTVTGTDANGCSASDSMVIDVLNVDISQKTILLYVRAIVWF